MAETAVQNAVRRLTDGCVRGMSIIPIIGLMPITGTTSTTMVASSE